MMRHAENMRLGATVVVVAGVLVVAIVVTAAPPPKRDSQSGDVLVQLLRTVDTKPDGAASKKLVFPVRRDVALPKVLREVLRSDDTKSTNLSYGFEVRDGRPSWFWRSSPNSLRIVGKSREIESSLVARMKRHGFDRFDSPEKQFQLAFRKQHDDALETALFVGCIPVSGGTVEAIETRFVWRIEAAEKSPVPTFARVIELMPSLKPPARDEKSAATAILERLPDLTTDYVTMGSNGGVQYSFRVRVSDATLDGAKRDALATRMVEALNSAEYKLTKPAPRDPPELSVFTSGKSNETASILRQGAFLQFGCSVRRR